MVSFMVFTASVRKILDPPTYSAFLLRLSMEIVAVYCERAMEHIDTNCVFTLQQFVPYWVHRNVNRASRRVGACGRAVALLTAKLKAVSFAVDTAPPKGKHRDNSCDGELPK